MQSVKANPKQIIPTTVNAALILTYYKGLNIAFCKEAQPLKTNPK
jgi:hypothetical protein